MFQSLLSACSSLLDIKTLTEVRSFRDLIVPLDFFFKALVLFPRGKEKEQKGKDCQMLG